MSGESRSTLLESTREEVLSFIKSLKSLDIEKIDFRELVDIVWGSPTAGLPLDLIRVQRGSCFCRGVVVPAEPENVARIRYPPPELVPAYHRAGVPGEPLCYMTTFTMGPLCELPLRPGDHLVIGLWRATRKHLIGNIGYQRHRLRRLGTNRTVSRIRFRRDLHPLDQIIHSFYAEQFSRFVPKGEEWRYKISAAIASIWLRGECDGLLYPSVKRGEYDNVAIRASSFDSGFEFAEANYYDILDVTDELIRFEPRAHALGSGARGELEWTPIEDDDVWETVDEAMRAARTPDEFQPR